MVTTHPELTKQWHPTKNKCTPYMVSAGSNTKAWWKCHKGDDHEWEAKPNDRTKQNGTGCPICTNQRIVESNCLATTHPELAKQWHPIKNKSTPFQVSAGSTIKAWWRCSKGEDHEWEAKPNDRTKQNGTGCPICTNQRIVESNCLATTHPELAKQWHPIKNKCTPFQITAGSDAKVWWKCPKGDDHEWGAIVYSRVSRGTGCPICSYKKANSSNCLATTHPDLAKQWHPTKNSISPFQLTKASTKKIWWKCQNGDDHVWEARISKRTKLDATGCPVCSNKKVVASNCVATTHPDLAKQWHPTKNFKLPHEVTSGSDLKVFWTCSLDDKHVWEAKVYDRAKLNGTGCPLCNSGWTIEKIKLFVKSLLPNIESLSPAELYVIFQQNGILNFLSKSGAFLKAVRTGKFPKEELEKFVTDQPSLVDNFIADETKAEQASNNNEKLETLSELQSVTETEE